MLDQNPDSFRVTEKSRQRERREFIVTRNVRICAMIEQHAHNRSVPVARGTHERRHPVFVTCIDIDAKRQDRSHLIHVTALRRTP